MEIWAHRGRASPDKLGNSINDFMSCYRLNISGVETDVSLTTDGRPIIYHPGSTQPDLTKMTWREIQNSIFDVLPLSSFLSSLKGYSQMSCCLDIKQDSEQLVEEIVKAVADQMLQDRVFVTAFQKKLTFPPFNMESDGKLLLLAKKLDPATKTHLIASFPFNLPAIAEKYQPQAISFGWLDNSPMTKLFFQLAIKPFVGLKKQIALTKEMGVKVWGGIVNEPEAMLYFTDLGADGIMTDDAVLGMKFKKEYKKNPV